MQSLALPRLTSLLPTPFGRPTECEAGVRTVRSQFSPSRTEQQSYPSPPMSEPHSPSRRPAQTYESGHLPYPQPPGPPRRTESGHPLSPPSSLYPPRPGSTAQSPPQHRSLYPSDQQHRGPPSYYQSVRPAEQQSYGGPALPPSYSYGYSHAGIPPYPGAQHAAPIAQPAAMIAPPPARPTKPARRTKAHVASACVNCKKAHLSCDVQRPCGRCVASGKQDTCKDVQHKKRGRPRLRDDREFTRQEEGRPQPSQITGAPTATEPYAQQTAPSIPHSRRTSDLARVSGNVPQGLDASLGHKQTHSPLGSGQSSNTGTYSVGSTSAYTPGPNPIFQSLPVAFLDLDLIIQKSNQVFQDLVGFLGDVKGKSLDEFLDTQNRENLMRLRTELREERDEREPTFMAPITPVGQDPLRSVMDSVQDRDVDHVSHNYTDRPMVLSFRVTGGHYQPMQVQIRLAKTSLYFVTLVVRTQPRPISGHSATNTVAPPASMRTSQPMSAPNSVPMSHITPHQSRPQSSTSSAPSSPYFNFSSTRTSLPTFSPSSHSGSPSYGYSPTTSMEPSYFPAIQTASQSTSTYPSQYAAPPRNASVTSEPLRDLNQPGRLEGLHLPPIRTGPVPLGSPVHLESSGPSAISREDRVRRREPSPNAGERRPETPETGKRRRLNIHEVLE